MSSRVPPATRTIPLDESAGQKISGSSLGRIVLAFVILAIAAFIAFPTRRDQPLNVETGITSSSPIEARLAALDQDSTEIITGSDAPYRRILFILAPKCTEDRDVLAQIAISTKETLEIEQERTVTTLQLLHTVSRAAPSGRPRRPCRELFDSVAAR
jgi:hypothetical protein